MSPRCLCGAIKKLNRRERRFSDVESPVIDETNHTVLFFFFSSRRPFVEFVSAPFWSVVSTRFRQAKNILLMAIFSWIIFTVAIGLIRPPPHSCWRGMNSTHQLIERVGQPRVTASPDTRIIVRRQAGKLVTSPADRTRVPVTRKNRLLNATVSTKVSSTARAYRTKLKTTRPPLFDESDEDDAVDINEEDDRINEMNRLPAKATHQDKADSSHVASIHNPQKTMGNPLSITHTNLTLVKPLASQILYDKKEVRNVFMVFLLLIVVGEFFSAPAITLAVSTDYHRAQLSQ